MALYAVAVLVMVALYAITKIHNPFVLLVSWFAVDLTKKMILVAHSTAGMRARLHLNAEVPSYLNEQAAATTAAGFLAALVCNRHSNIPPMLLSVIAGSLVSRVCYGDLDPGYQWSQSDLIYWFTTITQSLAGGLVAQSLHLSV